MRVPPEALLAIVAEVIATSALRASEGCSRLLPAVNVVLGYGGGVLWSFLDAQEHSGRHRLCDLVGCRYRPDQSLAVALYRQVPDLPAIIGLRDSLPGGWPGRPICLPPIYTQWRMV
jgi:small multidrug resistance pump